MSSHVEETQDIAYCLSVGVVGVPYKQADLGEE